MLEIDSKIIIGGIIGFISALFLNILTNFDIILKIILLCFAFGVLIFYLIYIKWKEPSVKKIIKLLSKYEEIKNNEKKEIECIHKLEYLFPKLQKVGFRIYSEDYLGDDIFEIHLTRGSLFSKIHQFLIRELINGKKRDPDIVYFSKKHNKNSDIQVLFNFIRYLKDKK